MLILMISAYFSPYVYRNVKNTFQQSTPTETESESEKQTNKTIRLKVGDYVYFGSYRNEPIVWKITDIPCEQKVLLISEKILCFKAFDACGKDSKNPTAADTGAFGSAQWETSTLKEWLNSAEKEVSYSGCSPTANGVYKGYNAYADEVGFLYDDNFSASERNWIAEDGVFLPSKEMLQKNCSKGELRKQCTEAAVAYNTSPYVLSTQSAVWYWTKTPLNTNHVSVVTVTSSGSFYKTLAYDSTTGVCPALYLKAAEVNVAHGNGSSANPYKIEIQG